LVGSEKQAARQAGSIRSASAGRMAACEPVHGRSRLLRI